MTPAQRAKCDELLARFEKMQPFNSTLEYDMALLLRELRDERGVPEGYVLALVEMNDRMFNEAKWAYEREMVGDRLPDADGHDRLIVQAMWKAMLAAAPKPPEPTP